MKRSTFTRGAITTQLYDKIVSTIKGNKDVADFRKTNRNFLFIDGNLQNPYFFLRPNKGEEALIRYTKKDRSEVREVVFREKALEIISEIHKPRGKNCNPGGINAIKALFM